LIVITDTARCAQEKSKKKGKEEKEKIRENSD
jgi:hypothetical protein